MLQKRGSVIAKIFTLKVDNLSVKLKFLGYFFIKIYRKLVIKKDSTPYNRCCHNCVISFFHERKFPD